MFELAKYFFIPHSQVLEEQCVWWAGEDLFEVTISSVFSPVSLAGIIINAQE